MTHYVYLKHFSSNKIHYDNKIELNSYNSYITTKKFSPGRWYYEFTHHEGSSAHLAGYIFDDSNHSYFSLFSKRDQSHFYIYYSEQISVYSTRTHTKITPFSKLDFTDVINEHIVGLSFDTFSRIFSIRYLN